MTKFDEAMQFATAAHSGQVDKAGVPYILHPAAVAAAVAEHGETAMIVALLHDVVEDTDTTIETIRGRFGPEIADPVGLLTKPGGEGVDYDAYLDEICADQVAATVKLADMRHNIGRLDALPPDEAERLRKKYERRITRVEAAVTGEPVTLSYEVDVHRGLPSLPDPTWAALYVMVSGDGTEAKVGACERLANVPRRQRAVERKYQERVADGTMRVVVKVELVGLTLFSGGEYRAQWADAWSEVVGYEFALRFFLARRLGRAHASADYIHVHEPLTDDEWVSEVRSAWERIAG